MSDITRKIFSIEPDQGDLSIPAAEPSPEAAVPVTRPGHGPAHGKPDVPEFVTRAEPPQPRIQAPDIQTGSTRWIMWTGLALAFIWLLAASAYVYGFFDLGRTASDVTPMGMAGLIMAVIFPAVLITLLWVALRKLVDMRDDSLKIAEATHRLTRAESAAQESVSTLAAALKNELAGVDAHLSQTVERMKNIRSSLAEESRALDATSLTLSARSDDVGRSLTLQRQALESISGTFDARMETLSATIVAQSDKLGAQAQSASDIIDSAVSKLDTASQNVEEQAQKSDSAIRMSANQADIQIKTLQDMIAQLEAAQAQQAESIEAIRAAMMTDAETSVTQSEAQLDNLRTAMHRLSQEFGAGHDLLEKLESMTTARESEIVQRVQALEHAAERAVAVSGAVQQDAMERTQASLAQTRHELSRLEDDMITLNAQLAQTQSSVSELPLSEPAQAPAAEKPRIHLRPLETDFPPVEPPRPIVRADRVTAVADDPEWSMDDGPMNLGADMEVAKPDDALTKMDPDILRRPAPETKGFGRNKKQKDKEGWRWRDMLGGLERPDAPIPEAPVESAADFVGRPLVPPVREEDIVKALKELQLDPNAVVDDGTIIEASKARLSGGPDALAATVKRRLASPVAHLSTLMERDADFAGQVRRFVESHGKALMTDTHPGDLRETLSSDAGRAYLLCQAAV